jgi:hypothetical protein
MDTTQHSRPLWLGVVASSVAVPTLIAALMMFSSESTMISPIDVFLVGVLITAPIACLVALPLALWLRRIGRLNAVYLCLLGTVVGALALSLYTLHGTYYPQMNDKAFALWIAKQAALKALAPGALDGFLSALALCVGAGVTIRPSGSRTGAA